MRPQFDYGQAVRVIRNVRNDGTFPGVATGTLLIRRGTVGYVRSVGTFLQDQIIYEVHFLEDDRMVGCRQEELIDAADPWVPSKFESREKVIVLATLAHKGQVLVNVGSQGQILKVWRNEDESVDYDVTFGDKVLCVPERALRAVEEVSA